LVLGFELMIQFSNVKPRHLNQQEWADLRLEYEMSPERPKLRQLADKHRLSRSTIFKKAAREHWKQNAAVLETMRKQIVKKWKREWKKRLLMPLILRRSSSWQSCSRAGGTGFPHPDRDESVEHLFARRPALIKQIAEKRPLRENSCTSPCCLSAIAR
jgi:hypothetical protein